MFTTASTYMTPEPGGVNVHVTGVVFHGGGAHGVLVEPLSGTQRHCILIGIAKPSTLPGVTVAVKVTAVPGVTAEALGVTFNSASIGVIVMCLSPT